MKRRRTMLLCVTATSMTAALGCTPAHPVGIVGRPDYQPPPDLEAGADAGEDAALPLPTDTTPTPDAGSPAKAVDSGAPAKAVDAGAPRDAGAVHAAPPNFHPDRVGTTANVNDTVSPSVGTTATVEPRAPKK